MEKKLKQVSEGQGFICATIEDKKRIWEKLTDAGYPMYLDGDDDLYPNIAFIDEDFTECHKSSITDPLNESDFFYEWTPQAGEWVDVSTKEDPDNYSKRQYLCTIDSVHLCVEGGASYTQTGYFFEWKHIRQIKPETMTLQEAQDKLREVLGKPNLVIEGL
jgi:hypothetical protein